MHRQLLLCQHVYHFSQQIMKTTDNIHFTIVNFNKIKRSKCQHVYQIWWQIMYNLIHFHLNTQGHEEWARVSQTDSSV